MNLIDYRELIKRYNPPKTSGIGFAYALHCYANILKHNNLSVSQTIVQLYKDKETGQMGYGLERPPTSENRFDPDAGALRTAIGIAQAIGLFLFTIAAIRVAVHFLG